jgi:hypothetical protein
MFRTAVRQARRRLWGGWQGEATVSGMDYLLTWNCRHIANPEMRRCIAEYLEQIGLFLPFMCTPEELLGEGNAE